MQRWLSSVAPAPVRAPSSLHQMLTSARSMHVTLQDLKVQAVRKQ